MQQVGGQEGRDDKCYGGQKALHQEYSTIHELPLETISLRVSIHVACHYDKLLKYKGIILKQYYDCLKMWNILQTNEDYSTTKKL